MRYVCSRFDLVMTLGAQRAISEPAARRLLRYLDYLETAVADGMPTVSSSQLGAVADASASQVRHDLMSLGRKGKRGEGYEVASLRTALRQEFGLDRRWRVCLIGVGKLGAALLEHEAFVRRGFDIIAAYDVNPTRVGTQLGGVAVRGVHELASDAQRLGLEIAIVTTPQAAVNEVLQLIRTTQIEGVLNFADGIPDRLANEIVVHSVDMTSALGLVAFDIIRLQAQERARSSLSTPPSRASKSRNDTEE